MKIATLTAIIVFAFCFAETAIVFETTFNELPAGWFNSEWLFSSSYAYICESVFETGTFEADMYTNGQPPIYYFVPDGTDSLVIHIGHDIAMYGTNGNAFVRLYSTSFDSVNIFNEWVHYDSYYSSDPIHHVIVDPPPDTWIGFRFHGYISATYPSGSTINWWVYNLTVTAHGDELTLEPGTWASIKNSF